MDKDNNKYNFLEGLDSFTNLDLNREKLEDKYSQKPKSKRYIPCSQFYLDQHKEISYNKPSFYSNVVNTKCYDKYSHLLKLVYEYLDKHSFCSIYDVFKNKDVSSAYMQVYNNDKSKCYAAEFSTFGYKKVPNPNYAQELNTYYATPSTYRDDIAPSEYFTETYHYSDEEFNKLLGGFILKDPKHQKCVVIKAKVGILDKPAWQSSRVLPSREDCWGYDYLTTTLVIFSDGTMYCATPSVDSTLLDNFDDVPKDMLYYAFKEACDKINSNYNNEIHRAEINIDRQIASSYNEQGSDGITRVKYKYKLM